MNEYEEASDQDRYIRQLTALLDESVKRGNGLDRELAATTGRLHEAIWRIEKIRGRRWVRLGEALAGFGRHPLRLASAARALRAALRHSDALPRPEPVVPPPPVRIDLARLERPEAPEVVPPEGPIRRPELTAAVIAGPQVTAALHYEWKQLDWGALDPVRLGAGEAFGFDGGADSDRPDLLFAEWPPPSGWDTGEALSDLARRCRTAGVPTALWVTGRATTGRPFEPPEILEAFDSVFAADPAALPSLRTALGDSGRGRVHHLPFAAQPRLHNPVHVPHQGHHPVGFEGAHAARLDAVLRPALPHRVHIFGAGPFPECYQERVLAPLPYERMLTARKQYRMMIEGGTGPGPDRLRRLYELAAAGVPVLAGPGVRLDAPWAGLVPAVADEHAARAMLHALLAGPELRDRQAQLALREVFRAHTYGHRVAAVLTTLADVPAGAGLVTHARRERERLRHRPLVTVVVPTRRPGRIERTIDMVARQTWRPLQLVMVLHGLQLDPAAVRDKARQAGLDDVVVLAADPALTLGACLNLGIDAADGEFIGKMDDDELYGPRYLADLLLAFDYTDAGIVGKLAHYIQLRSINAVLLRQPADEHRYVDVVRGGTILARGDLLRDQRFADLGRGEDTELLRRCRADGVKIYSADRHSFVSVRNADPSTHTWQVSDRTLMAGSRLVFYGMAEDHILF